MRILVVPNELRASALRCRRESSQLSDRAAQLRRLRHRVDGSELQSHGGGRVRGRIDHAVNQCQLLAAELDSLGRKLEQVASDFEAADNAGRSRMVELGKLIERTGDIVLFAGGGIIGPIGLLASEIIAPDALRERMEDFGRATVTIKPIEGRRALEAGDWAFTVADGSELLESLPPGVVPIVGVGISFSLDDDPNLYRRGMTAVVGEGMGAIPYVKAVMLVNAGVQLGGLGLETYSGYMGQGMGGDWQDVWQRQAESLRENFDQINLGPIKDDLEHLVVDSFPLTPAGIQLSNTVAATIAVKDYFDIRLPGEVVRQLDGLNNWLGGPGITPQKVAAVGNRQRSNLSDLGGHVTEFVPGLWETSLDVGMTAQLTSLSAIDTAASVSRLPESWRSVIHETTLEYGSFMEGLD